LPGFEPFEVVTLPFPFADRNETIIRPALVLTSHTTFGAHSGIALVAMITSAKRSTWPYDVVISDLLIAGLKVPCVVRTKINAVDLTLINRKIGTLGAEDRRAVRDALHGVLAGVLV
jgi:mRNA interferase MazF